PDEDDKFGRGAIEDFTWKGMLDFGTCTECGRCQSQCPAWNTGKPLSPKLLIMGLRDHALAKAPYLLAGSDDERAALPEAVRAEADRPLVGDAEAGGVIDPDVLWSCVTCGACVEQCPVDIEHVDHVVDMRRYQVLIESAFPKEAGTMLRNLERAGDPWGRGARARLEWTAGLPFEVPVVDGELPADVEYLFWVGCAGALDDRAKRTTRAVAELLHEAGVRYAVLGSVPGVRLTEMPRNRETSFCCGAGGARMWMEESIGTRINETRTDEALGTGAEVVTAACPYCIVMLTDGLNTRKQQGAAAEEIEVTDLSALLLRSVRGTGAPDGPASA